MFKLSSLVTRSAWPFVLGGGGGVEMAHLVNQAGVTFLKMTRELDRTYFVKSYLVSGLLYQSDPSNVVCAYLVLKRAHN